MRLVFLTLFLLVAGSLATRNDDLAFRVNEYLRNSYNFPAYQAPADDKTNILNFVKGFLNGVGTSSIFDNVKACIQDDQIIITDMINGVEMIQTKVASKVEEGIALIGKAVEIIPTAVEQCKVAGADLATLLKMVKSFKNPASFLYYVGKSIVINRVDVFKEVNSAVKAYQTGDFTNFGYWIGRAMDTIFIGQKALNAKDTKTDVVNFVKGFLSGVGSASVFDNIKTCIADVDTFGTDIYTAIEDIKSKDAAKVKQGIILLGQAAQLVPAAAQACQASAADIQKFIKFAKSFSNPEAFLYYIGKSLLINHVEVIHEVTSAVQAYENKDFTNLGYWVGKAMDTIILGQKAVKDTKTDIVNFVKGFLSGVGSASVFDDIKACIADVDTFGTDIYTAIEDIKTKDAAKVKQGIILLGQAAQIVPAAAKACQASAADVQKFLNFAKSFANPEAFLYYVGKSLLINHVEVIHEVTSAVQAYESKDWTNLGYWVGKAMDTIIIGQKALKDTQTDVLNFVKGFLAGVSSETIFDNIKTCVTDVDVVVKDVSEGIADIRTKNPAKVKEGIALLGQAAQVIPNAAQVCRASAADIQKFIKFAKTFTNPEAFLYYIGKSLLINHVEVIAEVKSAIAAFDAKNFTDLGYWVGRAMDTIIIGEKQVISQSFVDHLNSLGSTWRAAVPKKFEGMTYEQIKQQYLGAKLIDLNEYKNLTVFNYEGIKDVPAYFNSSEQWPGCVHPIRDQGHCGSCWAFAASEVLSDRFCIASNGAVNVVLSPQYLLSCNNVLNHGCNGGVPLFSWWFIVSDGLVTDSCLPYASANGTQPIKCKDFTQCADGSAIKNYHAVKGSVVQLPNPASIQANIQQYGPVETGFTVYQDFMSYAGGIYTHQSGSALGGHAVKIIGWGTENGTNFWIVANSWGPAWGENGFFRIAFGQCGIDSGVVTGQADVAKLSQSKLPFHRW